MSLNYFLNKKIIDSMNQIVEEQGLFTVNFPLSIAQKMNFEPMEEIESDKYLTNYFQAYTFRNEQQFSDLVLVSNISSLMFLENLAESSSMLSISNMIRRIQNGAKAKTKKEKMALNLVEAVRLVKKADFEINEDNFELLIHILFRNTEFNLDRKANYYRVDNKKILTDITINFESIDQELKELFKFINDVPENSFDGFTKAIIIFLQILIIQPYQKFNSTIALLVSLWFLGKSKEKEMFEIWIFDLLNHWEELIEKINESISNSFNVNELLSFIKNKLKDSVKRGFISSLVKEWIAQDSEVRSKFFPSDYEFIVLITILTERTKEVSVKRITDKLKIAGYSGIKKQEIKEALENLKSANIVKVTKNDANFMVADKQLNKYKFILE
ncbi:hypothetical protein CG007_03210 [Mesoplasma entomophilum]|uniref:hypothetical protein n=1 Tax=Mesoplasma entomophilum TaxID=2149 RepID=UPI000D03C3E2|nr:hypothetical protein [Mesoplasma entomophilum]AVN60595.1 hypothetical protein CG007_03210 [Mesoplasma entomophilum]